MTHVGQTHLSQFLFYNLKDKVWFYGGVFFQRKGDVFAHTHRIKEGGILKQHAEDLSHVIQLTVIKLRNVSAVYQDLALVRFQQADYVFQQHGLTPAAPSYDNSDPAGIHRQINAVKNLLALE